MEVTMSTRKEALKEREVVLRRLHAAESARYFSEFYPGSHEPTEEGFQAAQANERAKVDLRARLKELNKELGFAHDFRQTYVD